MGDDPSRRSARVVQAVQADLRNHYPSLRVLGAPLPTSVVGSFPVEHRDEVLDRFLIEIELPANFPRWPPTVRETGERFRTAVNTTTLAGSRAYFIRRHTGWMATTSGLSQTFSAVRCATSSCFSAASGVALSGHTASKPTNYQAQSSSCRNDFESTRGQRSDA